MTWQIIEGDCIEQMRNLDSKSIDAIVCDPPYELGFMGKGWDRAGVAFEPATWLAAWRVLKPGGHLLAFGGTRTFHRLTVAIEDAGFEVRDCLAWLYGSGFPKSLDVSKAIDKASGEWRGRAGDRISGNAAMSGANLERTPKGSAATLAGATWEGWGTALKPAWEPIILARKPLAGTVAATVLAYGTGALNIDASRIGFDGEDSPTATLRSYGYTPNPERASESEARGALRDRSDPVAKAKPNPADTLGRWPANVVLDEAAAELLDEQSGVSVSRAGAPRAGQSGDGWGMTATGAEYVDQGGASRFFYTAKTSTRERNVGLGHLPSRPPGGLEGRHNGSLGSTVMSRNTHPTVKPVELMQWLCRLVTPKGGLILDPFTGSGSTGIAALREGFNFLGIEREPEYVTIARARIVGDAPLFNTEGDSA